MAPSSLPCLLLLLLLLHSARPYGGATPPAGPKQADPEQTALIRLKNETDHTNSIKWNQSQPLCSPWDGVKCTKAKGTVVELRLPAKNLNGTIPEGIFGNLTSLQVLDLSSNAITGPLPSDLSKCTQLQELRLDNNLLSGGFPAAILSLTSLTHLNLSGNNLSGTIPDKLNNLKNLSVLLLERNSFSGKLPDLLLPVLAQFNVSNNTLINGPVPAGLRNMSADAFRGTSLCGEHLPKACPNDTGVPAGGTGGNETKGTAASGASGKKVSTGAIVAVVAGSTALLLVVVGVVMVLLLCRSRKEGGEATMLPPLPSPPPPRAAGGESTKLEFLGGNRKAGTYELEELLRAPAEELGRGTFGTTCKAAIKSGVVVAAKMLNAVEVTAEEFRRKVEAMGAAKHPNVMGVDAYHYSSSVKLLLYEYMPMGSLHSLLHGIKGAGRMPLIWPTRLNIALTAARGVEYIHSRGAGSCHGNIKSSNILLASSYNAKVSDHSLYQLAKPSTTASGHLEKASQKADVYSFGVVLLEMLTGKEPGRSPQDLLNWVVALPRDEWSDKVLDAEMVRFQSAHDEMEELLHLAIECCHQSPNDRPTMADVVRRITEIQNESAEPDDD